jgi:hypothetical protein
MKTEHTKRLVIDVQHRLGLTYEGFRNKYHVFSKKCSIRNKISHQYFFEDVCTTCEIPRLNRKQNPAKNCKKCSNAINTRPKNGVKRKRATKKTIEEKSIMDTLFNMAEENQRQLAIHKNSGRVTRVRL